MFDIMPEMDLTLTSTFPHPRLRRWMRVPLAVLAVVVLHWLFFRGREVVPGVIARPLGPCDVEWFDKRDDVVVIACPHTDLIKLWPLPIERPWFEDPLTPLLTAGVN